MKYNFKRQDAFDFANFIGIKSYERHGNLQFRKCPYCGKNTDDKNTFGISLDTGVYQCFRSSCGAKGTFFQLARDFDFKLSAEFEEYYKPKKKYRTLKTPEEPLVPKPNAISYLQSRGISEEIARKYEITVQTEHDNILVFPFYDEEGKLQFVKYRKTDFDKTKDNAKEWCEASCKPILFGMKQCNMENKTMIIAEGMIDSLSIAECGFENALSVPTGAKGFTWIPYCWDFVSNFDEIIVFGDHEKGHITLLDEFASRWGAKVKHIREKDYLDCKDANEILVKYGKEQIKTCIENAVPLPVKTVIDLADVENVDVFKLDKLKTGIHQLDKLLYGGLPMGGVVLISGRAGQGKSTFASQIMAYAIEQGKTCFAYSGELPNYLFKSWFDMQIAGDRHTYEYQTNQYGEKQYAVSDTNKKMITNWYRGKFFLYDNSSISGEEKESLIKTIDSVVLQYGVEVVLIDNLMTALDLEITEGEKYEKQSLFVKRLARLALKYNILILLVAHKRKSTGYSVNENEEVAGSSDIGNLATVTLAYEKADGIQKDSDGNRVVISNNERLLKVSKNRLFGRVNTTGWVMGYSEKSKRVYGLGDSLDYEFGWNKDDDGFEADINEDTPF